MPTARQQPDARGGRRPSAPTIGNGRSVIRDLTRVTVCIVVLVSAAALIASLALVARNTHHLFTQKAEDYLKHLQTSLEMPLWTFDQAGAQRVCQAMLANEFVAALVLKDADGTTWFSRRKHDIGDIDSHHADIHFEGRRVGAIELGLTSRLYRENQRQMTMMGLVTLLVLVLVLVSTNVLLLGRLLRRPLNDLLMRIDRIAEGDYRAEANVLAYREFVSILERFDEMGRRVAERENLLATANRRLEEEIVERMGVEASLRQSEERFRSLHDNLPLGVFRVTPGGRLVSVNPAFTAILGYPGRDALHDISVTRFYLDPNQRSVYMERLERDGRVDGFETQMRRKDGVIIWVSIDGTRVTDDQGRFVLIDGIITDITARKTAELALRESQQRVREAFELSQDVLFKYMLDSRDIVYVSPAVEAVSGFSADDLRRMGIDGFLERVHPDDRQTIVSRGLAARALPPDQAGRFGLTYRFRVKDGTYRWIANRHQVLYEAGQPVAVVGNARDVTEERRLAEERVLLERQLQQAQKMEAIGTLAGGIAHDFNNILGGILGFTELAQIQAAADSAVQRSLSRVLEASLRAKELVQQILQFSRQTEPRFLPVCVAGVVVEALKLLRASLPSHIEIRQDIQAREEKVMADATQLHQVVMNLCANAAYAMRETGGEITVSLAVADPGQPLQCRGQDLAPGRYLHLRVADTGLGMSATVLDRIFDPYFTTKPAAEGTGLGLSVVIGIVRASRGGMQVKSAPGAGTVLDVYLPYTEAAGEASTGDQRPPVGTERVLFVDDEIFFVDLAAESLGGLGYRVTALRQSPEALERFRQAPQQFDLLITDQTMPRMSGLQLAQQIHALRPDLPIILCTGFSEAVSPESASRAGVGRVLAKPVSRKDLARAIREVLDDPPAERTGAAGGASPSQEGR